MTHIEEKAAEKQYKCGSLYESNNITNELTKCKKAKDVQDLYKVEALKLAKNGEKTIHFECESCQKEATFTNQGAGGNPGQGGLKLQQYQCKLCNRKYRLKDLLEAYDKERYECHKDLYEQCVNRALALQTKTDSIMQSWVKKTPKQPITNNEMLVDNNEPKETHGIADADKNEPKTQVQNLFDTIQTLRKEKEDMKKEYESLKEIMLGLKNQVEVLTQQLAAGNKQIGQRTGPVRGSDFIEKQKEYSAGDDWKISTKTKNKKQKSQVSNGTASSSEALPSNTLKKSNERYSKPSEEAIKLDDKGGRKAVSYADLTRRYVPVKERSKRAINRMINDICIKRDKPALEIVTVYISIQDNKRFKQAASKRDYKGIKFLINLVLKKYSITKYVIKAVMLGTSMIQLFVNAEYENECVASINEMGGVTKMDSEVKAGDLPDYLNHPEVRARAAKNTINQASRMYVSAPTRNFKKTVLNAYRGELLPIIKQEILKKQEEYKPARNGYEWTFENDLLLEKSLQMDIEQTMLPAIPRTEESNIAEQATKKQKTQQDINNTSQAETASNLC